MSLHATTRSADHVTTITLAGHLDQDSVPRLSELVGSAGPGGLRRLVLRLGKVQHLSSAAVRCLADLHQKLGRDVQFVLTEVRPEAAETIRLAGLHRSVTMYHGPGPTPAR